MKRTKFLIVTVFVIISVIISLFTVSFTASADLYTYYGDLRYSVYEGHVTIWECKKTAKTVDIPSYIDGYPVTKLASSSFANCTVLQSVTMPDTLTEVGGGSFKNCSGLRTVTIGSNVKKIHSYAFENCASLKTISIPPSVDYIGEASFKGCTLLESISLPYVGSKPDSIEKDAVFGIIFGYTNTETSDATYQYTFTTYYDTHYYYYIPASLKTVVITDASSIPENAFLNCENITTITLADGVSMIGESAFENCTGLTEIILPDSLSNIDAAAFRGCESLVELTIPENVSGIGFNAFENCTAVETLNWNAHNVVSLGENNYIFSALGNYTDGTEVVFGDNIGTIPAYMFGSDYSSYDSFTMPNITSVVFGSSVNKIGDWAFADCDNITEITIPSTVNNIGNYAFYMCDGFTDIDIPDSITTIGDYAFACCYELTDISLGESVANIGASAFEQCVLLPEITFPDSLKTIGENAFKECESLENITFGKSLTSIGANAFNGCVEIPELTIPESVTSIGSGAFGNCFKVETLNWNPKKISTLPESNGIFSNLGCSSGGVTVTFGEKVESVPSYCFYSADSDFESPKITSVTLADSVKTIGDFAFCNCSLFDEITIPSSVTSVGNSAFSGCSGLNGIIIPDKVKTVGNSAFKSCTGLSTITIGKAVTSIGDSAFEGCTGFAELTIPSSVRNLGVAAFADCDALEEIVIPSSITAISNSLFEACNTLESVTIPSSVKTIGESAFSSCGNLLSVSIPDSVTDIGDLAFSHCNALEEVTFGKSVKNIGAWAFEHCYALGDVEFPGSLETIGESAFENCSLFTTVIIPDSVTSIGVAAFKNCNLVKSLVIGKLVSTIGNSAFEGSVSLETIEWNAKSVTCFDNNNFVFSNAGADGEGIEVTFTSNVENIPGYCFGSDAVTYISPKVTYVYLGDNIKEIREAAFMKCTRITNISIPEQVTTIGDYVFEECTGLTSVIIPYSVSVIGDSAFANCTRIANLIIGDSVKEIGDSAFSGCSGISRVTLGNAVETVGKEAFRYCSSLESIIIPVSVEKIGFHMIDYDDTQTIYYKGSIFQWEKITFDRADKELRENAEIVYNATDKDIHKEVVIPGRKATCEETGLTDGVVCAKCEEVLVPQTEIPKTAHTPGEWQTVVESAAGKEGKQQQKCKVCQIVLDEKVIPALPGGSETPEHKEHTEVVLAGKAATCISTGLTEGRQCSVCGEITLAQTVIPVTSHIPGAWETVVAAEVGKEGKQQQKCTVCSTVLEEKVIPALPGGSETPEHKEHTEVIIPATATTCTEPGLTQGKKCSVCGEILVPQTTLPATGHVSGAWEIVEAAQIGKEGKQQLKCVFCNEVLDERIIPALPGSSETPEHKEHTEEVIPGKEATCMQAGLTEGKKCSVCGEILVQQETIPATGHVPGTWEIVEAAQVGKEGRQQLKCTVCGEVLDEKIIPALPGGAEIPDHTEHSEMIIPGIESTCTQTGLTEGKKCYVCGVILVPQTTLPALGHSEQVVAGKDATCVSAGYSSSTKCAVCGITLKSPVTVPATGHTLGAWVVKTPAKVGVKGLEVQKCTVCNAEVNKRDIPALAEVSSNKVGDANGDGKITAADARITLRISAKLDKIENYNLPLSVFDATGDNKLTAADARKILRVSAKLESM